MKTPLVTEPWTARRGAFTQGAMPLFDVRSEKEFARGAVPGAVNVPLLSDAERHDVGLAYKTVGAHDAVHMGMELFAAKCEAFRAAIDRGAAGRKVIGVHCWRGGMRSTLVATWLGVMGYEPVVLRGGYNGFRKEVLQTLEALAERDLLVLDGRTGAGKSALLTRFPAGFPLLDFEGLAHHRGSAFGDFAQKAPVPTQQNFENKLADLALDLPPTGPILVEIETLLGPIYMPHRLKEKILISPIVQVSRDFDDRVDRLTQDYVHNWDEAADALFAVRCALLKKHLAASDLETIIAAVERRDFRLAIEMLLRLRYDKAYDKGIVRREPHVVARFNLTQDEDAAVAWIRDYVRR